MFLLFCLDDIRLYEDWTNDAIKQMGEYLNSAPVRAALHVGDHRWNSGDGEAEPNKVSQALVDEIEKPGTLDVLGRVLDSGSVERVVVYDGNQDGSPFNHLSTEAAMEAMNWSGNARFKSASHRPLLLPLPAGADNSSGGGSSGNGTVYLRSAPGSRFGFLVVPNAGHLVPTDQPALAAAMIEGFVAGEIP